MSEQHPLFAVEYEGPFVRDEDGWETLTGVVRVKRMDATEPDLVAAAQEYVRLRFGDSGFTKEEGFDASLIVEQAIKGRLIDRRRTP